MRLAQGHLESATAAIRRALDETADVIARARLLGAQVEVELAANKVPTARAAADELATIAAQLDVPLLLATAKFADGSVILAEGDARTALGCLRSAWTHWQELEAPYHAARVRVLIGQACSALGDEDTAEMELDAVVELARDHVATRPCSASRVATAAVKPTASSEECTRSVIMAAAYS